MQLNMPEQRPLPGVDTRPRPLREWLSALPYVDAECAARAALERLQDINHQALSAPQRLELLAAFRHCHARLHDTLSGNARGQDLPRDRAQAGAGLALLADFTEALSHGYKYALRDALTEKRRWGRAKVLAEAAHHTLQQLGHLLVCRYQAYQPVSEQVWREIGELVRFAETEDLPAVHDRDHPYGDGELHVLRGYRQLALLRLADPYRLPPGTVWEAFGYIAAKSALSELLSHYEQPPVSGVYGLPLDREPQHSTAWPASGIERNTWRWLDARAFLHAAQLDLDRLVSGTAPMQLGFSSRLSGADAVQLLGRMLGQWTHSHQRKALRFSSQQTIEVASGLDAAYYFLNHGAAFDQSAYTPPEDEDDIDLSRIHWRAARTVQGGFRLVACSARNRSNGGLSLHVDSDTELPTRVGQLLLLAPAQDGDAARDWLVGVVRWLISRAGGREIGIQYIARDPAPVALRVISGPSAHTVHPALKSELPLADGQRLLTLLAPRGAFKPRAVAELHQAGQVCQIRCAQLIESGHGFERFSYEPLS